MTPTEVPIPHPEFETMLNNVGDSGLSLLRESLKLNTLAKIQDPQYPTDAYLDQLHRVADTLNQFCTALPQYKTPEYNPPRLPMFVQILESHAQKDPPTYPWAGAGQKSWQDLWVTNRIELGVDFIRTVTHELLLPEFIVDLPDNASYDEIFEATHAPSEYPGLRFLPGYRVLNWEPPTPNDFPVYLVLDSWQDGKITFEDPGNQRQFYIATTGGMEGLERLFNGENIRPTVVGVVNRKIPSVPPSVLFDIDYTLRIVRSAGWGGIWNDQTPDKVVSARTDLLQTLHRHGISVGLWSRNDAEEVVAFARQLQRESGVRIDHLISFSNWPFIDCIPNGNRYTFFPWDDARLYNQLSYAYQIMNINIDLEQWMSRIRGFYEMVFQQGHRDQLLESKAPPLAALALHMSTDQAKSLFHEGVIVNDAVETLYSALLFNHNFIFLDSPQNLGRVIEFL